MSETQDWNSGQGAYPSDLDTWTLTIVDLSTDQRVVRHMSPRPTLDEILSCCTDEMGDIEREVKVAWYLEDPNGNETDGKFAINPTVGTTPT